MVGPPNTVVYDTCRADARTRAPLRREAEAEESQVGNGGGERPRSTGKKKREMGDPRGKLDARSAAAEKAKVRVRGGKILAS